VNCFTGFSSAVDVTFLLPAPSRLSVLGIPWSSTTLYYGDKQQSIIVKVIIFILKSNQGLGASREYVSVDVKK